MSLNLNKAVIAGRVGADPEIRTTQKGTDVANFSVATNVTYIDKQTKEKQERTEWHRVVVFGELASKVVGPYVKKGSPIYIEGEIRTRKWETDAGDTKYTTEIVVQGYNSTLKLNGNAPDAAPASSTEQAAAQPEPSQEVAEDEIPF